MASNGGSEKAKQQIPQLSHGSFEGVFMRHLNDVYEIILNGLTFVGTAAALIGPREASGHHRVDGKFADMDNGTNSAIII